MLARFRQFVRTLFVCKIFVRLIGQRKIIKWSRQLNVLLLEVLNFFIVMIFAKFLKHIKFD